MGWLNCENVIGYDGYCSTERETVRMEEITHYTI